MTLPENFKTGQRVRVCRIPWLRSPEYCEATLIGTAGRYDHLAHVRYDSGRTDQVAWCNVEKLDYWTTE